MSKRFLKTLAVASTICLTLLGSIGAVWGMWEELDENQKCIIKSLHTKHFYKTYYSATASLYNENQARPYRGYKTSGPTSPPTNDETTYLDCEKCQNLGFKYVSRMHTLQLIDRMNGILQTTHELRQTIGGSNEKIQQVKNEIGSIQQLTPSLLLRNQEEQIKIPVVIPELKKIEEETKAPAIFHAHLDAAEDKGRKEEKREIAKKLIAEQMSDEMIFRITGLTVDDLVELKRPLSVTRQEEMEDSQREQKKKDGSSPVKKDQELSLLSLTPIPTHAVSLVDATNELDIEISKLFLQCETTGQQSSKWMARIPGMYKGICRTAWLIVNSRVPITDVWMQIIYPGSGHHPELHPQHRHTHAAAVYTKEVTGICALYSELKNRMEDYTKLTGRAHPRWEDLSK